MSSSREGSISTDTARNGRPPLRLAVRRALTQHGLVYAHFTPTSKTIPSPLARPLCPTQQPLHSNRRDMKSGHKEEQDTKEQDEEEDQEGQGRYRG